MAAESADILRSRAQTVAQPVVTPAQPAMPRAAPAEPLADGGLNAHGQRQTAEAAIALHQEIAAAQHAPLHKPTPGVMPYARLEHTGVAVTKNDPALQTDPHYLRSTKADKPAGPPTWHVPVPGVNT
jgi:hypothetical protein